MGIRESTGHIVFSVALFILMSVCALPDFLYAARLKDIAEINGVRKNQLIGYGLVVGLNGTGDKSGTGFTEQSISNMMKSLGVTVSAADIKVKNVASAVVTADLPPFAKTGNKIDVLVSSIGDAKSLQGGTLLLTPLRAPNGEIYAVAQGPVSVGGFSVGGEAGGGAQKNHPTVGMIADGGIVEKEIRYNFTGRDKIMVTLRNPDFTTASRVAETINRSFNNIVASPVDSGSIDVSLSNGQKWNLVNIVASLEMINVHPDSIARVVIDERTGTVVMGENVRISTVAISHGNLSIQIKERQFVSQPNAFARGKTTIVPDSDVTVEEPEEKLVLVEEGVSIGEVVKALNAIGVTPRDLISIFQTIKAAGALHAALEVI